MPATWRGAILVSALTVLALLPFIQKPFHMDDTVFVRVAQQILVDPLAPYDFDYNWTGGPLSMWKITQHPPLHSYLLAGVISMAGTRESALHGFQLGLAAGCAALTYWLACRFCQHPRLATLLSLATPAFFVSATNLMADVTMLFFWLLAVVLTVRATDESNPRLLWLAAFSAAAAALTKYFGIALVPLLLAHCWMRRDRFSCGSRVYAFLVNSMAFGLPAVGIAVWGAYSQSESSIFHPLNAASYAMHEKSMSDIVPQIAMSVMFFGGCCVWPLFLSPNLTRSARWVALTVVGLAGFSVYALRQVFHGADTGIFSAEQGILAVLMALSGALMLVFAATYSYRHRDSDSMLLGLWFWGVVVFATFVNWTVNARVVLPAVFPATLIVVRWAETLESNRLCLRWLTVGGAVTLMISLALAWADYQFAAAGKDFAQTTVRKQIADRRNVLFSGHWGFQFYMEQEGARPINYNLQLLRPGDLIVHPLNNSMVVPVNVSVKPAARHTIRGVLPVHLMSGDSHSGFYSSVWGELPFSIRRDCVMDEFQIDQVVPRK